jgi:hypothetical protein
MQEYRLVPERTTQSRARWDEGEGFVVAALDDPVLVYGENSSGDEGSGEESAED